MDAQLSSEVRTYQELKCQLIEKFGETDEETLADTLEGVSDLPDLLQRLLRTALSDEAAAIGLRGMISGMRERLERIEQRARKKRDVAALAMEEADIKRIDAPDFTVGLRPGSARAKIVDETAVPSEFWRPQPARLDKAGLMAVLKTGRKVTGALLTDGAPTVSIRTT